MVPTRVSHSRSRYPLRWVSLVSVRSCSPAPTRSVTSASINSCASSRTPSRKKLGSAPCSDLLSRSNSVILRLAIVVVLHVVLEHRHLEPHGGLFVKGLSGFTPRLATLLAGSLFADVWRDCAVPGLISTRGRS